MPLFAVGKGDILHLLPVQQMIPDELVVGQDAGLGQAKAVQPAAVAGVGGFARLLAAVYRSVNQTENLPWGGAIRE